MKITKTFNQILEQDKIRMIANMFCDKCPFCGEERPFGLNGYKSYGIMQGWYRTFCKGIFKIKHYRVDCYKCFTCETEWEGNPYEN